MSNFAELKICADCIYSKQNGSGLICKHNTSIDKNTNQPRSCHTVRFSMNEMHCGIKAKFFKEKGNE